jgi:hypothetical protein
MADKTIGDFTAASSIADADLFEIETVAGNSRKATLTVLKAALPQPYLVVPVRAADASLDVNSTSYVPVQSMFTTLDFTQFPATKFRITARAYASQSGQTVTLQLDEGETGVAPISAAGNDLAVTYNGAAYGNFSSGWINVDGALTGKKDMFILLKGSNTTVDIVLRQLIVEWAV